MTAVRVPLRSTTPLLVRGTRARPELQRCTVLVHSAVGHVHTLVRSDVDEVVRRVQSEALCRATGAGPNLYRCAVARTDSGHAVPLRPDGAIRVERPGPPGLHGLAVPDAELDTRAALPRDVDALAATVVDDDARGERSRCWSTLARGPLRCIRRRRPAPRRGRFRLPGRPGGSRVLGGFFR